MSHRTTLVVSQTAEGWQTRCDHCADAWLCDTKEEALETVRTHIATLQAETETRILVHRQNGAPEEEEANQAEFVPVAEQG